MLQKIAYELGESANTVTFPCSENCSERLAEILILLEAKIGNRSGRIHKNFSNQRRNRQPDWNCYRKRHPINSEFKQDDLILLKEEISKSLTEKGLLMVTL
jgi:hypothetical protein